MTARLVVLASGSGTNCEAILKACSGGHLGAEVVAVVTNNANAAVIDRAKRAGLEAEVVVHRGSSGEERAACDQRLAEVVAGYSPDLVVLAGWMRILGASFGSRFRTINLHPAKPGGFPGLHAIERAYRAWGSGEISETGVMVHWVKDAGVDTGPVIVETTVEFSTGESFSEFENRLHLVEHELIVDGIRAALAATA